MAQASKTLKKPSKFHHRPVLVVLAVVLLLAGGPPVLRPEAALAHPLGNFTINQHSQITLREGQVHLDYVLDMAETPAFLEIEGIDLDNDGKVSDSENARYRSSKAVEILDSIHLSINDNPVILEVPESILGFPEGQGGLDTLRLDLIFAGR